MDPVWHPSPNFGQRRLGQDPDMILLHHTAMRSWQDALARLCDPKHEVSAHYLITASGIVYQMVDEKDRAWHAGQGSWGALQDINSHSIGIEIDNAGPTAGNPPFTAPQMTSLVRLLETIRRRWNIPPERVIGHSDTAPERKTDPGPKFDWTQLARLGHAVDAGSTSAMQVNVEKFRALCTTIGYADDLDDQTRLSALRLRFRPGVTGPLDGRDMAIAADIAARFAVDRNPPRP